MDDYRGQFCLIDNKYIFKCIAQDFMNEVITFEIYDDGPVFHIEGEHRVMIAPQITSEKIHGRPTITAEEAFAYAEGVDQIRGRRL